MQIGNIIGSQVQQQFQNASLSNDQRAKVDNILSKFDPDNFSQSDFETLRSELRSEGIGPSHDLKSMIEGEGFAVESFINKDEMKAEIQSAVQSAIKEKMSAMMGGGGVGGLMQMMAGNSGGSVLESLLEDDSESTGIVTSLLEFMDQATNGNATSEDQKNMLSMLDFQNLPSNGVMVNRKV